MIRALPRATGAPLTRTDDGGAALASPRQLTETGLVLPESLPYDEWLRVGATLGRMNRAVTWWLGDWWAFGEHRYGERSGLADEDGRICGVRLKTLRNAGVVSRAVETSRRRDILSWKHHAEVASLPPERQDRWLDRAGAEGWSSGTLRAEVRRARLGEVPALEGTYRVIYADPPWHYAHTREGIDGFTAAADHYPTMTVEEIGALPVGEIADENSVLFLWVTVPLIYECAPVIDAWGFRYKSMFIWDKVRHNYGNYNSLRHEILLVCTRGSCAPEVGRLFDSVVSIERTAVHSRKPREFLDMIDELYPSGPRIELFAREAAKDGWHVWGAEAPGCGGATEN